MLELSNITGTYTISEETLWAMWRTAYGTHTGGGSHGATHLIKDCRVCERFALRVVRTMLKQDEPTPIAVAGNDGPILDSRQS